MTKSHFRIGERNSQSLMGASRIRSRNFAKMKIITSVAKIFARKIFINITNNIVSIITLQVLKLHVSLTNN